MPMYEITFHGRGGQGSVTAAELLAIAAFNDGLFCQAFPYFGVERRGAPVQAFCRIDEKPIRLNFNGFRWWNDKNAIDNFDNADIDLLINYIPTIFQR